VLFESSLYDQYHQFLVSGLSEKPEIPLPEITTEDASYDTLFQMSDGFTFPVVVRGFLGNTTAVQKWGDHDWWINNYGTEELLCGTLSEVRSSSVQVTRKLLHEIVFDSCHRLLKIAQSRDFLELLRLVSHSISLVPRVSLRSILSYTIWWTMGPYEKLSLV